MGVLHVTRDFPPRSTGGLSSAIGGLVQACSVGAPSLETAVASFNAWRPRGGGSGEAPGRGEVFGAEVLRLSSPEHLEALEPFARRTGVDVVHVHDAMLWDSGASLARSLSVPCVYTAHVLHGELARLRGLDSATLAQRGEARAFAEADVVSAPSRFVAAMLRRERSIMAPIVSTPLAVSDSAWAQRSVADRRARTTIPASIVMASRFADVNGISEVLEALPRLLDAHAEVELVIAGGLPENRKAERRWRRRFDAALEPLGAAERGRVLFAGWLRGEALAEAYRRATLLWAPSWIETFGLTIAEAQLHGLCVVACRGGAAEERIDDGVSGRLCSARDVDALLAVTLELLAEPIAARAMGLEAARRSREAGLWRHALPAWLALYERLGQGFGASSMVKESPQEP